MNLQLVIYYIKREVQNAILKEIRLEDKADIIINTSDDSLDDNEFDLIQGTDYNIKDDNIDVDQVYNKQENIINFIQQKLAISIP